MHFTCRQMATQNGVKSSACADKTLGLSNWSLHPKDPQIRIIEGHFLWVHRDVKTQTHCVTNYMHQGAWRFFCRILRGCRTVVSLCVPHIYIISLPESCKEHVDPAAPHWSHVLFLRQAFQADFPGVHLHSAFWDNKLWGERERELYISRPSLILP